MATVVVATTSFAALAHQVAETFALPGARIAVVDHPLGGISESLVQGRAEAVIDTVLTLVTKEPS